MTLRLARIGRVPGRLRLPSAAGRVSGPVSQPPSVTLVALFPNTLPGGNQWSVDVGETPGTKIIKLVRRTPGSTITITPNDGRLALSDNGTDAYILVGLSAASVGQVDYTVTESHLQAINTGGKIDNAFKMNFVAAGNDAALYAAGYRAAGTNGQMNNASRVPADMGGRNAFCGVKPIRLGRATYDGFSLGFSLVRISATTNLGELITDTVTIAPGMMSVVIPTAPIPVVEPTWGSSAGHAFTRGVGLDFCDPLLPAQFGLTQFEDSTEVFFKIDMDIPTGGIYCVGSTDLGMQAVFYDSANRPAGFRDQVMQPGFFTGLPTGAQPYSAGFFPVMLVGKTKNGAAHPPSVFAIGDSVADRLSAANGGYIREACRATNTPLTLQAVGGRMDQHTVESGYHTRKYLKFHSVLYLPNGINDLSNGFASTMEGSKATLRAEGVAAGIMKFATATIPPRINDGNPPNGSGQRTLTNWRTTDLAHQFYYYTGAAGGLGYEPGGSKDQINAARKAAISQPGGWDFVLDIAEIVGDPSDKSRIRVMPFRAALTVAYTAGSNVATLTMDAAPTVGMTLVLDAGTAQVDPPYDPTGGNNYGFRVVSVTGTGPYVVTIQTPNPIPGMLPGGPLPLVNHPVGTPVSDVYSVDETHMTTVPHGIAQGQFATWLNTLLPAYVFSNTEASAFVARMTSPPSDTRKSLIDTLFGSLKSSGVYAKLDAIWLPAAHDAQAATLNLKGVSYTLTPTNAPAWAVNKGYTGNGTNAYVATNFNPTVLAGSVGFVQDSAHIGAWVLTDSASVNFDVGSQNGRARLSSRASSGSTGTQGRVGTNSGAVTAVTGTSSAPRHIIETRTGAAAAAQYINGAQDGTSTAASNGIATGIDLLREGGGTSFSDRQIGVAHVGAGLTASEVSALYNATRAYLQGVGAAA